MSLPREKGEQNVLPTTALIAPAPITRRTRYWKLLTFVSLSLLVRAAYNLHHKTAVANDYREPTCPQVDVLTPTENADLWKALNDKIGTAQFKADAVSWLSGAVQVPTESYDNMDPVGTDPRWEVFAPFHDYLLGAFPRVHTNLKLTKVNTYGLYYEWKGTDESLKPLLLAAHQDVVPVDPTTVDQWTHPPYSGFFDGERVWGRGSVDDKSGLIGILSTIETLLGAGFQPVRTVVLSFGFDEESSGFHGAGALGEHLLSIYGENGFAMIVDEGSGFTKQFGSIIATPGIAEKGFLNVQVEVTAAGGHSSIPPPHTSIGILSALLVRYEKHPYEVKITRDEPVYHTLQCLAQHASDVPSAVRKTIKDSARSKKALHRLQKYIRDDLVLSSLVGTTGAVTLIQGGVKSNALPERATAIVNRRISVVSSLDEVKQSDTQLLEHLGRKFNLTYEAFGTRISKEGAPASGTLTLTDAFNGGLEPAPITPTGSDAAPYQLLSGTIKATYNVHRASDDADAVIVAPSMMSGNTDTRFYWKLSPHIFRYNHHNAADSDSPLGGVHTVNESHFINAFIEQIRFFTTLILNADESKSL